MASVLNVMINAELAILILPYAHLAIISGNYKIIHAYQIVLMSSYGILLKCYANIYLKVAKKLMNSDNARNANLNQG